MSETDKRHVVIVGDFAALGCAQDLADHGPVDVTLRGARGQAAQAGGVPRQGIMGIIGRAAIAEAGKRHRQIHGELAHMAWLGCTPARWLAPRIEAVVASVSAA